MKIPSPVTELKSNFYTQNKIKVYMKRDDLIDQDISGNKWRKLKYNLKRAKELDCHTIITFGGAYSNHIAATAAACNRMGFNSIGYIRGEEKAMNHTLELAKNQRMNILYLSRAEYKKKSEEKFLENLKKQWPNSWIVPEGGANWEGALGAKEILAELNEEYDYICCSAGTGTTAAGLVLSEEEAEILIFPALKGAGFLEEEIKNRSRRPQVQNLKLILDYHFGGYGKGNASLRHFYQEFKNEFNIELDLIYTAKMMYGVHDLISNNYFSEGSRILIIHTGGIQGNQSLL